MRVQSKKKAEKRVVFASMQEGGRDCLRAYAYVYIPSLGLKPVTTESVTPSDVSQ